MPSIASTADGAWQALPRSRRTIAGWALWLVATLPVLSRLVIGRAAGDLTVYRDGVDALLHGPLIYRDMVFEYPPYALPWLLLPYVLSNDLDGFRLAFGLEMWVLDAAIKGVLLWRGVRAANGLRALAPFFAYAIGSGALGHVLLQRYDLVPAALTLAAMLAVAGGRTLAGGMLAAIGAGAKLYPALAIPALAVFAARHGAPGLVRFAWGLALGALPLVLAAFWTPWWRFASYHAERGLQAESFLASVVWTLHFFGVPAGWESVWRSNEVTGPVAAALVAPGRLVWVAATLSCAALATWAAWRMRSRSRREDPLPAMAVVLLLPIAAFVATNTVLSPQFHLWLLPLAALVLSARRDGPATHGPEATVPVHALRAAMCIVVASVIVPVFYPHREYATGLGPARTAVLVLRNLLLLCATVSLWMAVSKIGRKQQQ